MESVAFAVPIRPGQTDRVLSHVEHLVHSLEHAEHGAHRKRYMGKHGFTHVRLYHQTAPSESLVVYLEAPNLRTALTAMQGDPEFPREWQGLIEEAAGADAVPVFRGAPAHLVMDFHHEEGHRHRDPRAHLSR